MRTDRGEATTSQLLVVAVVVCALTAAMTWAVTARAGQGHGTFSDTWVGGVFDSQQGPPIQHIARPQRLLPPTHAAPSTDFALLAGNLGSSVRWDPCQPIRYVVGGTEPFLGADALLKDAFAKASQATGLKFVDAGVTSEDPTPERSPYQPILYGDRWAPVLVAWTDSAHVPAFAGDAIGLGGPRMAMVDGSPRMVSGIVYFDSNGFRRMVSWPDVASVSENIMLHEIGHLIGLGHVPDGSQVMYPQAHDGASYGAGDLAGLSYLGDGPCFTDR